MLALTKSVVYELGSFGICVNAIAFLVQSFLTRRSEYLVIKLLKIVVRSLIENAQKRRIYPRSVADLVYFLISCESDMITGQNFAIDAGWQYGSNFDG